MIKRVMKKPATILFVVMIVLCVIMITSMVKGNIYIGDQIWKVGNGNGESSFGNNIFDDIIIKSGSLFVLISDGYGSDCGDYIIDII